MTSNGLLLVGTLWASELYVIANNSRVTTIALSRGDTLRDVTWTSRGHIVYTTDNSNKVVVISRYGDIIAERKMTSTMCVSASADNDVISTSPIGRLVFIGQRMVT